VKSLLLLFWLFSFTLAAQEDQQSEEQQADTEQTETSEEPNDSDEEFSPIEYEYVSPIELRELQKMDILDAIDEKQIVWLNTDDEKILALLSRASIGRRRGVAVMLPDWMGTQFNHDGMGFLREHLNELGWVTLSVLPPKHVLVNSDNLKTMHIKEDASENPSNEQETTESVEITPEQTTNESTENESEESLEENSEDSESSSLFGADGVTITVSDEPPPPRIFKAKQGQEALTQEQIDSYQEKLMALMRSTFQQTRRHPGYYIVVAQGTSAAWLNKMYAGRKIGRPHAMIVIAPYVPEYELNKEVPIDMAQSGAPTLDFFSKYDNRWALSTASERRKVSKQYFKLNYRQREVFGLPGTQSRHDLMLKEIYGWLVSIGMM
jgi:hypothetical protein